MKPKLRARASMTLNDAFLTLDELATYAGLSKRTLERWLLDAVSPLPFYRFGKRVVVKQSEYDEWARRFRVERSAVDIRAVVDAKIAGR